MKQKNAPFPGLTGYLEFLSLVEAHKFRLVFTIAYKNIRSNFNDRIVSVFFTDYNRQRKYYVIVKERTGYK